MLLFSGAVVKPALADTATSVTISPSPATINPGETVTVSVIVNNVTNLYGADIRLSFDPAKLEVVDADPLHSGIQVTDGNFLTDLFVIFKEADNTAGTIKYVTTQVNPTPEQSGSGVLFYINLRRKSGGTTTLQFTQVDLATRAGQSIEATSQDGTVILTDTPVCQAVSLTTSEDITGEASPSCSDPDTGKTLSFSIVAQPGHGSASIVAGKLSYTPAANYNGTDSFTYKANDGTLDSNPATVNITVTAVNDAPVAIAQSVSTTDDTAKTITLTGMDVDGDSLTYSVVAGPSHGVLSGTAPNLTYTPDANYTGSDSFIFKAYDGTLYSNIATVSITVTAVNDAPIITEGASINVTMSEDGSITPFSLTLHATDADGDTLTWSINTPAGHGTASASGTGTSKAISYTPAFHYSGSDSFVVQVADGSGYTDTITVNVNITAVEHLTFTIFLPIIFSDPHALYPYSSPPDKQK
jgi:VCBS repeat-containing protein